jgi:hypothetical protein
MADPRCLLCRGLLSDGEHETTPPPGLTVNDTTAVCIDASGQITVSADVRPVPFTVDPVQRPINPAHMAIMPDGSLSVVGPDGDGWLMRGGVVVRRRG